MSIKAAVRFTAQIALAGLLALPVFAQQQEAPPATTPDPSPAQTQPSTQSQPSAQNPPATATPPPAKDGQDAKSQDKNASGTSKDRLFFALPNFLSLENASKAPPLTPKQKFAVVARGTFDRVQYPWWGLLSGLGQAENSEPGFGQGALGYAKRYGTTAADSSIENFMVQAVLPSILRQDPRFFQSSEGSFMHRTGYAVSRIFVTRSDSGHQQFNYSEIFGAAMAASISTFSYHPHGTYLSTPTNPHMFVPSDRNLKNAASVWGTQVSYDAITIVIKEFWPDIHRKMSHKSKTDAAAGAAR